MVFICMMSRIYRYIHCPIYHTFSDEHVLMFLTSIGTCVLQRESGEGDRKRRGLWLVNSHLPDLKLSVCYWYTQLLCLLFFFFTVENTVWTKHGIQYSLNILKGGKHLFHWEVNWKSPQYLPDLSFLPEEIFQWVLYLCRVSFLILTIP